jgi:hypothetical protein
MDEQKLAIANEILDLYGVPNETRPEDPAELLGQARATVLLAGEQFGRIEDVQLAAIGNLDEKTLTEAYNRVANTLENLDMKELEVSKQDIMDELEYDGEFNLTQVSIFDNDGRPVIESTIIEGQEIIEYAPADLDLDQLEALREQAYDLAGNHDNPSEIGNIYYIRSQVLDTQTLDGTLAASITSSDISQPSDDEPNTTAPSTLPGNALGS